MSPAGTTRALWRTVAGAAVWSTVLVVGAFTVPVYATVTYLSSGAPPSRPPGPVHLTQTLFEVDGLTGVLQVATALVATTVVALALRGGVDRASLMAAWTATGLLALFSLLASAPLGVVMLPATGALVAACVMATPSGKAAS